MRLLLLTKMLQNYEFKINNNVLHFPAGRTAGELVNLPKNIFWKA